MKALIALIALTILTAAARAESVEEVDAYVAGLADAAAAQPDAWETYYEAHKAEATKSVIAEPDALDRFMAEQDTQKQALEKATKAGERAMYEALSIYVSQNCFAGSCGFVMPSRRDAMERATVRALLGADND